MADRVGAQVRRTTFGPGGVQVDGDPCVIVHLVAERGQSNRPTECYNESQFLARFGGTIEVDGIGQDYSEGAEWLRVFWSAVGGSYPVIVNRIVGDDAVQAYVDLTSAVEIQAEPTSLRVHAKGEGAWSSDYSVRVAVGTRSGTIKLSIEDADGYTVEGPFDNVDLAPESLALVNASSDYATYEAVAVTDSPDQTFRFLIEDAQASDAISIRIHDTAAGGTFDHTFTLTVTTEDATEVRDALATYFTPLLAAYLDGDVAEGAEVTGADAFEVTTTRAQFATVYSVTNGGDVTEDRLTVTETEAANTHTVTTHVPATGVYALDTTQVGVDDNAPNAAAVVGSASLGSSTGMHATRDHKYGHGFNLAPGLYHGQATVRAEMLTHMEDYHRMPFVTAQAGATVAGAKSALAVWEGFAVQKHWPRLRIADRVRPGGRKTVEPSAELIGSWIRTLRTEGPGKPPANRGFTITHTYGPERNPSTGLDLIGPDEAADLLGAGINPIWSRDGVSYRVLGARNGTTDGAWRYTVGSYLWCLIANAVRVAVDETTYDTPSATAEADLRESIHTWLENLHRTNGNSVFSGAVPDIDEPAPNPDVHAFGVDVRITAENLTAAQVANGQTVVRVWFREINTNESQIVEISKAA